MDKRPSYTLPLFGDWDAPPRPRPSASPDAAKAPAVPAPAPVVPAPAPVAPAPAPAAPAPAPPAVPAPAPPVVPAPAPAPPVVAAPAVPAAPVVAAPAVPVAPVVVAPAVPAVPIVAVPPVPAVEELARRAPRSVEGDLPTLPSAEGPPMLRRAPRSVEGDLPTLPSPEGPAMLRRGPRPSEGDFATPVPRREIGAPPVMRRAPASNEPDLPTPAPRSGPRSGRSEEEERVLSVADLDRRLKRVVEGSTENVRVGGEVSNLKEVASGHIYFTLKDEEEEAAIDCVMYRTAPARSRRILEDGARVVVRGRATIFVPRGRLQLTADEARLAGRGALLEALERLKEKLQGEGLFDRERKRALPRDAKVIGVVTSADGAAIHDIIKVAFARGAVRVVLARAPVQGRDAAPRMARALATLGRMREVEAIIVGRGGGSADDLIAFNEEVLVREAARCRVPVVSAVGHEVDISLLDLVADARAATPSQAAEMLVPDANARRGEIGHLALRMRRALGHRIAGERADVERRAARLLVLPRALAERQQWVDDALGRIEKEMGRRIGQRRAALQQTDRVLWSRHPRAVLAAARHAIEPLGARVGPATTKRIAGARREIEGLSARLGLALERRLAGERAQLAKAAGRLDALSPLSVLSRGYAIATKDGRAVRAASEVAAGDRLRVRVHDGAVIADVIAVEDAGGIGEDGRGLGKANGGGSDDGDDPQNKEGNERT